MGGVDAVFPEVTDVPKGDEVELEVEDVPKGEDVEPEVEDVPKEDDAEPKEKGLPVDEGLSSGDFGVREKEDVVSFLGDVLSSFVPKENEVEVEVEAEEPNAPKDEVGVGVDFLSSDSFRFSFSELFSFSAPKLKVVEVEGAVEEDGVPNANEDEEDEVPKAEGVNAEGAAFVSLSFSFESCGVLNENEVVDTGSVENLNVGVVFFVEDPSGNKERDTEGEA